MNLDEVFREYYHNVQSDDNYKHLINTLQLLINHDFIDILWLKQYLLETKMLNYSFNHMVWILSGVTFHKYSKTYISYDLKSRLRFKVRFNEVKIKRVEKKIDGNVYNKLEFKRGDYYFILPKIIFELDYMFISLDSKAPDDIYTPEHEEDQIPIPIIQIPKILRAEVLRINLYFLEEFPDIWENMGLKSLEIKKNKFLKTIPDKFDKLVNLERLSLLNFEIFPISIYESNSIGSLSIGSLKISGNLSCNTDRLCKMKSLTHFEMYSPSTSEEKNRIELALWASDIHAKVRGPII